MKIENIAHVVHEVNRAFCESMEDNSQVSWENAPEWQKESAYAGVKEVLTKPNITPKGLFEEWKNKKIADGWVYGPVKDAKKLIHPCLVPYEELPVEQRVKDYLFLAVVRTMIKIKE